MLSKDQIEQLEPFCDNFRYGKLITNAVNNWKKLFQKPIRFNFGIIPDKGSYVNLISEYDNSIVGCCLIGSALNNKKCYSILSIDDEVLSACKEYNLDEKEIYDLINGFDLGFDIEPEPKSEAYKIGKQISKIIFKEIDNE